MRTDKGFIVKSDEARFGDRLKMKGVTLNILDLKISSADTNGDVAVFVQTGKTPKGGPPLHVHLHQDEWFHVLEGDYKFQVGDDIHLLSVGDTIFLPRNVQHAFVQLTDKGKMLVTYMPAGKMESFFKVTDKWTSPLTKEEITKALEDHDMKITGPPLSAE
jgi:quercetin dioxygenase-like cupin family protein